MVGNLTCDYAEGTHFLKLKFAEGKWIKDFLNEAERLYL